MMTSGSLHATFYVLAVAISIWTLVAVPASSASREVDFTAGERSAGHADRDSQSSDLDAELATDLQWLREKTSQLAAIADKIRAVVRVQSLRRGNSAFPHISTRAINKRHCWDVADVCCMWNIC